MWITSACAEQTCGVGNNLVRSRDHLRVCGADVSWNRAFWHRMGSPPRVRSRPDVSRGDDMTMGITSACAEQTPPSHANCSATADHLRVCGADGIMNRTKSCPMGSPPRVRSRRASHSCAMFHVGITSACAEQTATCRVSASAISDHLRVCGADGSESFDLNVNTGSPPRVRSRPSLSGRAARRGRITSACAEQTGWTLRNRRSPPDHLRVCGADSG